MVDFKKPTRPVDRTFIHCSASDLDVEGDELYDFIRMIHVDQKKWSDIGYHFMIDKRGTIMPGRPIEKMPAAQYPYNRRTIAIMVHGLDVGKFTAKSMKALNRLCSEINEAYDGRHSFHGHCEISSKTCPVFDYKSILKLDRFGRMP